MGKVQGDRKLNSPASSDSRDNTSIPDFGSEDSGSKGLNEAFGAASGADSEVPVDPPNKLLPGVGNWFCTRALGAEGDS